MQENTKKMKWIVITMPEFITNEATYIEQLFEAGIDLLHLRKPDSSTEDCEQLLQQLNPKWYSRIVVHDHFELCEKYHLHGIHLNRRNHHIPDGFSGSISRSCHSLEEIIENKDNFDYVFLSPIFDSISKQGYQHAFTDEKLAKAAQEGIIDNKVIALGGISEDKIPQLKAWHFGGAAFLGAVWNQREAPNWQEHLTHIKK